MPPVDFKKWRCRPVEFKGQGPQCNPVALEGKLAHTFNGNTFI